MSSNESQSASFDRIDFDHNATTCPFPEVIEAMSHHFQHSYANPGSRHAEGRTARKALEDARESIAEILGASPSEIIFTSSGTESTNMAIFGFTQTTPGTIALTAGEHPATSESCRRLFQQGWKQHVLDVDSDGLLLADQYDRLPWQELKLVTIILAHNETGVVQDVTPLADCCREHGVPLHIDAVQSVGKLPVDFHDLGATSLSLGAHKFHGPRGIGALLLRDGVELPSFQLGGHQEAGRRPGTEPVALIVGMATALRIWNDEREERIRDITAIRDRLEGQLSEMCAPVVVNGSQQQRLPNTLNIAFPGVDGEALLVALDLEGIACSLGSTCASGSAEPAPVLVAMGRPPEVYRSSVRLSIGIENSVAEIDEAASRIARVDTQLRSTSTATT